MSRRLWTARYWVSSRTGVYAGRTLNKNSGIPILCRAPPAPPQKWAPATRDATRFAHNCIQAPGAKNMGWPQPPSTLSEDCLYLNVYTPLAAANATGTDKRRDEHAYVSVYEMLWDPIRFWMRNVTEVGVHFGVHFETSCLT